MRRTEEQFNTYEQVLGYCADALAVVAQLDPTAELAAVVFGKAIDLLAAKQVFFEQPQQMAVDPRFLRTS